MADDRFDLDDSLDQIQVRGWSFETVHEVAQMAISMLEEHSVQAGSAGRVALGDSASINSLDDALQTWPQTFLAVEAGMSGR